MVAGRKKRITCGKGTVMAGTELTVGGFDYQQIEDEDTRGKLVYYGGSIRKKRGGAISLMLEIGADLMAAQDLLANYKTGVFGSWLAAEFDLSQRSAYRMIAAAKVFGGNILCHSGTISDTALYLLSEEKCPEPAKNEALDLIKAGKSVNKKIAKNLIAKYTVDAEFEPLEPPKVAKEALELLVNVKPKPTEEQLAALAEYEEDTQIELAESVAKGIQTLDQAIETGEVPEETADQAMQRINKEIESHCRAMKKQAGSCPEDPWLDRDGLKNNAVGDIVRYGKQLRLAKCTHVCPGCEGAGCKHCLDTGRMPDFYYKQMSARPK